MVSTPLNIMKYAYKRKISLERKRVIKENTVAYPDLNNVKNKDIYRYRTETFLKECVSYKDALSLMETMYMDNQFDILEETVNSTIINIIPTVESSELPNCIATINNSVIGDINRDRLTEAANNYKSIDRILKNHKTLSKRFRIDSLKGKSEKDRMHTVCEMVCTYGRSNYINFNIALEEAAYLESINDFRTGPICEDRMVKYITDYFLEFDNNSAQDIQNYRKAIIESKILSNNANSILKTTMINLSWALGKDRNYLTGKSDKLNNKYISHQRICKDQSYFINRYFMNTLDDSYICMIADIINIPAYILRSAKTNKVFVNDKIMHKLTNAIKINNSTNENIFVGINRVKNNIEIKPTPQEILNKDIEETKLDALSIIKIIDNLDTEDISKIGKYCMAEAERRNILESLENK